MKVVKELTAFLWNDGLAEYNIKMYEDNLCAVYELRSNEVLDDIDTMDDLYETFGDYYYTSYKHYVSNHFESLKEYFE